VTAEGSARPRPSDAAPGRRTGRTDLR